MTIGSLFSGIGGLELGLERAGLGPVRWQIESDRFARSVLAKHWPHAERFDDVCTVGAAELAPVDLICGGFPCQDISLAGTGRGLAGARSGLFFELARIVGELRPRIVVLENVSAILVRGVGDVLGALAALGYDAWWDCIPAAAVGAPHRRDRFFLVAWRVSDAVGDALRVEPERGEGAARPADAGNAEPFKLGQVLAHASEARPQGAERARGRDRPTDGGALADGDGRRLEALGVAGVAGKRGESSERGNVLDGRDLPEWPPSPDDVSSWGRVPLASQPAVCRVADGAPRGLDRARLKAIGNAVVPAVAEIIGRAIKATC